MRALEGIRVTKDDRWVAIACSNDDMFARLAEAMGQPELAGGDRYGPKQARLATRDKINEIVAAWVGALSRDEVLGRCHDAEVPCGPLYAIDEIFEDPQYAARQNIVVHDSRIGPLPVPGPLPVLSETPGEIRWLGSALGGDTDSVLADLLGLSAVQIAALHDDKVV